MNEKREKQDHGLEQVRKPVKRELKPLSTIPREEKYYCALIHARGDLFCHKFSADESSVSLAA